MTEADIAALVAKVRHGQNRRALIGQKNFCLAPKNRHPRRFERTP